MKTYTGKHIDDILKEAAADKNTTVENLTYHIVEEVSGFLGLGTKITAEVYSNGDIAEFMKDYLRTYFDNIHMGAEIDIRMDDDFYHVNIDAENNAILIGKNGQTLQVLNNVLKSAVSSEFKKRIGVLIDINGYKKDKYHKICSLAHRVAKSVQRTKTDAVLDPMPADERKAIHNYLANMKYVSTVSEGEGKERRLKIVYNPSKERS